MDNKEKFTKAIELYTGGKVKSISIVSDPQVFDTYAIRAEVGVTKRKKERVSQIDFLVVGNTIPGRRIRDASVEQVSNALEETQFTSWPPTTGRPRFF